MKNAPKAGDIIICDFTPGHKGREIRGERRALVVSSQKFNKKLGQALVCPISRGRAEKVRKDGYLVSLMGACSKTTDGSVHIHQLRSIDLQAREAKVIDKIRDESLEAVLAEVQGKILLALDI